MIAGICFALLKIKTAKTDALEPATQPVSMAGCGIGLHAHERDRMIGSVEKEVQIPPGEAVHNVLVCNTGENERLFREKSYTQNGRRRTAKTAETVQRFRLMAYGRFGWPNRHNG
jgi:hypothetical protein